MFVLALCEMLLKDLPNQTNDKIACTTSRQELEDDGDPCLSPGLDFPMR